MATVRQALPVIFYRFQHCRLFLPLGGYCHGEEMIYSHSNRFNMDAMELAQVLYTKISGLVLTRIKLSTL